MLFADDELVCEFDFGNEVSDEKASIKSLAMEINRISQILADKKQPILFKHKDNHGENIAVQFRESKGEDEIYDRSPESIQQLLFRKGRESTISKFLEFIGIDIPKEGTSEFKEYLQLLYFFYMMRYYAFEDDSFFRIFKSDKEPTSELSPVEGTSLGKYLWFIMENMMDDKTAYEVFISQDYGYSTLISIITSKISSYISEDSFYENEARAQEIEQVINECCSVETREWTGGLIIRALDSFYQYQMLGYARDMLQNLTYNEMSFYCSELEVEAPIERWSSRYLNYEQIEDFLKEKEVATFCKQNKILARPDKALRNGSTEIVKYVFKEDQKRDSYLFVEKSKDGITVISALRAALIAKTFIDLTNEKILVDIKKKNGWDHSVGFNNAMASSDGIGKSKFAADIAYRLFVVAFHSEYLSATKGHGYWPVLFRPIYLRQYVYVQKCVYNAFSGKNPNVWRDRLHYIIYNFPSERQEVE